MITGRFSAEIRGHKTQSMKVDFVVVGGGLSGVCAAVSAARMGSETVLIQDRPVLGGNASSEVRLWALGATSHMGNNNRWSREGGLIDEILVENLYRNKAGNPIIFDTVLLEKVLAEPKLTLLLNTAVFDLEKTDERNIRSVKAFNSQNSTEYHIEAPLFCDASGDGIVGFKAGAGFRIGAESKDEFGELFAPDKAYGELLGHSMFFYSKETDRQVKYVAPSYALKDISQIPRHKLIRKDHKGCNFWWFEYGGRKDTIHETEEIKWELWKVIYGVWDYIKNSGEFEGVDCLDLEWVANVPGKRESRRFEGLYMLKQQDVLHQRCFDDAVAFGGWALDLHPADGIYSELSGCTQWHSKGIYDIPYRSYVSRDIDNLFLAGRIISASHVAFGSSRVMLTCAFGGQAVGTAADLCGTEGVKPSQLLENGRIRKLQNILNMHGQSIPGRPIDSHTNLLNSAVVSSSSSFELSKLSKGDTWVPLKVSVAQLLPLQAGIHYQFRLDTKVHQDTTLEVQLRVSEKSSNYTPEVILEKKILQLSEGEQTIDFGFETTIAESAYAFITFVANEYVSLRESDQLLTGVMTVFNGENKKVSNTGKQEPPEGIGVDAFEFWIPLRRPEGKNLALSISQPLSCFELPNLGNGYVRPWVLPNAWVASLDDPSPELKVFWEEPKEVSQIKLFFNTDYDHAMESVQYDHPEDVIPFCVRDYQILDWAGSLIFEKKDNYQTINTIQFAEPRSMNGLRIQLNHPSDRVPASLFEILIS